MTRGRCLRVAAGCALGLVLVAAWARLGPLPAGLLEASAASSTLVTDRHGVPLYEARDADGGRSVRLEAGALPGTLVDATIAAEDRRFMRHPGVDPIAVVRAAWHNARSGGWVEGGSTLTQQVVKLLRARREPRPPRGLRAKAREALWALRLEHRLSKRDILALYLNLAPYGNQLTGADRASRAYFGHEASLLTPAQAAFLAALPQRPSRYNPYRDPDRARARQRWVIAQMRQRGVLDATSAQAALAEQLTLVPEAPAFIAPHFVARVLATHGGAGAASLVTSLDGGLQRDVSGIIRAATPTLRRYGAQNVAAVVLDNATGEWLAWEGSGDYDDSVHGGRIDGVVTPRQPGSALKPFTYALAFEDGESPATVLADIPSHFPTAEPGVLYSPRNYDGRFRGPLLARQALAGSENVPAVALASSLGVPNVLRFLRTAGFSTLDRTAAYYGVGVTLGDAEVRLDELVAAYAAFARGGIAIEPSLLRRTTTPQTRNLVSSRTAFWITSILADDHARAYAFGRGGSLEFPFEVAVKTGTSQAYHDNWTIGYTRTVTVGVWVGNFDRRPLVGSSGVTGAAPIFHAIMLAAVGRTSGVPDPGTPATLAGPEGTIRRTVCALSGLTATAECPRQVEEWVAADAPERPCYWHERTPRGITVRWPQTYRAWAASQGLLESAGEDGARVASYAPATRAVGSPGPARDGERGDRNGLRVVNPPEGAVYLLDPTLRSEYQTIALRSVSADRSERGAIQIEWRVDGRPVGTSGADGAVDWPLEPGQHLVSAHAPNGDRASVAIVVR